MEKVLVTGTTGYIGLHCVAQLLESGYHVRGSMRSKEREPEVRNALAKVVNAENRFETCELNLMSDAGWDDAAAGCDYVLHIASPLTEKAPDHEDDIIIPARDGLLRAVKSAVKNRVKRFVMTSSFSAVGYGHAKDVFDESHWTDPNQKIGAYNKSKAIAEKAMWNYLSELSEEDKIEAVAINPTLVVGPSLSDDMGSSNMFIQRMLDESYSIVPQVHLGFVSVKDTARAHIDAMTHPEASGKRFILSERNMWLTEMNEILNRNGYTKAPTKKAPNFLIKLMGIFNKEAAVIAGFVGKTKYTNSENAKNILKFNFDGVEDAIVDTAKQMEDLGLIVK